jgi:hypothetical protein
VAAERLCSQGFGRSRPLADNATEEGMALNRRVEFTFQPPSDGPRPPCPEELDKKGKRLRVKPPLLSPKGSDPAPKK